MIQISQFVVVFLQIATPLGKRRMKIGESPVARRRVLSPCHREGPSTASRDLAPTLHSVDERRRAVHDAWIDDLDYSVAAARHVVVGRIQHGPLRGPTRDSPS